MGVWGVSLAFVSILLHVSVLCRMAWAKWCARCVFGVGRQIFRAGAYAYHIIRNARVRVWGAVGHRVAMGHRVVMGRHGSSWVIGSSGHRVIASSRHIIITGRAPTSTSSRWDWSQMAGGVVLVG